MKRKNKPIRRQDTVQPLPLPADAGEIAFAHGVSRRVVVVDAAESPLFEQIIYIVRDDAASGGVTAADLVQQARDAVGHVPAAPTPRPRQKSYTDLLIWLCSVAGVLAAGMVIFHRILPVLRLVMVRISCDPEGYASSGSFSAEKPVVNA